VIAALAMLVVVVLTAKLARPSAYAAAFVGWNPLLALHFAGGGHNDVWMMALFLGALTLWRSGRRDASAALWIWAIAIKWVPLMWLPLDAAAARRRLPGLPVLGVLVGIAFVAVIATWRFGGSWFGAFLPIKQQVGLTSSTSIPFHVAYLTDVPSVWVGRAFFGLFVALYGWLLLEAWRGRARRGLAAALLLCCVAWLGPWYLLWAVPLAVIDGDETAQLITLLLSAFLLRDLLPIPWIF
jgi:alpha-1,6-mannosyltransferase